ncbi:hypothetical protein E4U14_001412 [Claviceps sp. LM454 group G7]|nr:hypothetical protein E4U14_001412 [Claviceps sp. LM454 group G7]
MGSTRSRDAYRSRLFSHGDRTGRPAEPPGGQGFSDVNVDDAVVLLVLAIASSGDLGGDDAVDRPGLRSTRCMKLTNTGSTIQIPCNADYAATTSWRTPHLSLCPGNQGNKPVANLERASNAHFPF